MFDFTEVKKRIQSSYSQFLNAKGLKPRYGQKLMIAAIARTLGGIELDAEGRRQSDGHIAVIEAGTGTGKTVAYLLAAIPVAQALGKKVVVSTATVALQEQIVFKDLPDILRHSGLDFNFGIAKGRGRYLCLSKLDRLLADDADFQIPLVDETGPQVSGADQQLYQSMMDALSENRWQGDKDDWPEELDPQSWQRVTTDHRQCTGRKCSFVRQCAFFKARDSLLDLDVIVANHDLLLADLALGGGAILSAPEDTLYILDEGHHLPEKSLNHFSAHTRVVSTSRWLGQSEGQWSQFMEPLNESLELKELALPVEAQLKSARTLLEQLQQPLAAYIDLMDRSQPTARYRFARGEVPPAIETAAQQLQAAFSKLGQQWQKMAKVVNQMLEDEHAPIAQVDLETAYSTLGAWCARAEANESLWHSFAHTQADANWPMARWITLLESNDAAEFELVSSPVLASHTLARHLWEPCCAAVVTSATMTALGSFERFRTRAGTPEGTLYERVPSPFDFARNAVLRLPRAAVEGNQVDAHTDSLVQLIPSAARRDEACLVLFASRRQMQTVFDRLPATWREHILLQGVESKQALLNKHRQRIDQGQGSMIFGLASFSEGVDLPGKYCDHVIIAKIPFAVPTDPLEAAMAEWIESRGGKPFLQMAVPDAAVKLVQACGRLLRSEADTGRVTILDRRLVSKSYGSAILDTLPPYRRELSYE